MRLKVYSGHLGNLVETPFDGDEMNMHLSQNILAETELRLLAATTTQIVSPSSNVPIIAIYQDSLLGSYRITREGVKFTARDAMNLLMMYPKVNPATLFERSRKEVSNFELLSQIMPPLTLKYKTKLWDSDKKEDPAVSNNVLEIYNGRYIRGQIDKSVMGGASKGIIHRICNDYGKNEAANFIDNLQNIVTEYMKVSSYSVGVSDLMSNRETSTRIIQAIQDKELEVAALIQKLHAGAFENNTSFSNKTEFEAQVNNVLNDATKKTDEISRQSLNADNRFLMIVNSGSKGSLLNISHMISCLGQVNVDSKRVPYGFDCRTLPHFCKFDDSPSARGFIKNSYIGGLNAHELFFHAMGGRIGLIDTAVKSVSWETPIVLLDHGKPIYTEIGRWIDGIIDGSKPDTVQKYEEKNMELVNIDSGVVYVPTMDENGVVSWEEITAVTRHDPGNVLYEIKSMGGRSVIVTESKSLLIWNAEKRVFNEVRTPEIKVGDCLPVTAELGEAPITLNSVSLADVLPKSEYVYGTDFNKAVEMMNNAMEGRNKIPTNWWESNNTVEFTLPYPKKSGLHREIVHSNTDGIKSGYVYPYHGVRSEACIPEEFELNEVNGRFIGLFLADGHATNEHVHITKNNTTIQDFVKSWFDSYNINYSIKTNTNAHGSSATIQATNGVLARFLTKWLGKGSSGKHVPTEAFIADKSFMRGLISGYFSGDGTISKNSIEACSASKRLIEGINMILSRLGIFGKVFSTQMKSNNFGTKNIKPSYRLSIRSHWGAKFARQIELIEDAKQEKLMQIKWNSKHANFDTHNNVVLDPIVEITPLSPENYPKMYDLTIPSTLNFGLANGLQVRDTSQTGYIQRRLIKGLEDLKVDYDMTVRNSNGKVIQFSYGEDSFDPMFVENQSLPIVSMSTQDIYMHYDMASTEKTDAETISAFNKGASARMGKQRDELRQKCKKYIDMMLEARDSAVKNIFKNKNVDSVLAPVAFMHITNNIQGNLGLAANSIVDITPLEAFQLIEEYFEKLKYLHYAPPNPLFETLYFYYLNPRELLLVKRFHRKGLILLLETVFLKYKQALVQPGEMVGVVAGQSIGEPTTQLTLNSFVYETEILVRNDKGVVKCVQIGDFAKWGIETTRKMEYMSDKDTTYAELSEFYEVPSATEDGRTVWRRIEAVTKHPVINEDGSNTMLKVITKGNREVIATKVKSFLRLIDGKIKEVNGSELSVGDYLPVSKITHKLAVSNGFSKEDEFTFEYSDLIPNLVDGKLVMEPRSGRCPDLEFDQIVSIEEVPNTTDYAYDLTVEETRNFDCRNGLALCDTFHTAGVASKSNVTRGVPRIEEILRLTKNPKNPSMTVFLNPADESNQEKAKQFANMMEHTRLADVVSSVQICFDPDEFNTRIVEDRVLVEQYYAFSRMLEECNGAPLIETPMNKSKWIVRLELDTETLLDKNITMDDIHFAIKNGSSGQEVDCAYADYNADKLVFRIRMSNITNPKKRKGLIEPLDQTDEIHVLKKFQDDLLSNIVLRGVSGIENVLPRKLNNMVSKIDGKYEKKDTWVLDTTGSNLLETLGLDYIDSVRTHSNDIREMFDVLGIEAARQVIHDEIVDVLEFSGAYANYHHLSLLCDRMTTKKGLVSIFRTGLFSDDIGPIAKSTFEVHTEVLLDAARFGEVDNMRGVSANVMCGQPGYYGTNAFQLVLDMNEMAKLEAEQVAEKVDPMTELFGKSVDDSDVCPKSKIEIKNNISGMKYVPPGLCDDDYDAGF